MATRMIDSPVGLLVLTASADGVTGIGWVGGAEGPSTSEEWAAEAHLDQVEVELGEYFAGTRIGFDVVVDRSSRSGFRGDVLAALETVPRGTFVTYGELARMAGRPRAARAVGTAMASNPVAVIVPCHRVLPAGGGVGNFGGGTAAKELLLRLEGCRLDL
jgi:methylated-DNA-[protein]-cysteine S-methyltransferase